MKKIRTRNIIALIILYIGFSLTGCAALWLGTGAGAGAGGVAYMRGEVEQVYSYDSDKVWQATLASLKEMNIRIIGSEKDSLGGKINAARGSGEAVSVKIKTLAQKSTSVKIRVGKIWWDSESAKLIHSEIGEKLKKL